MRYPEFTGTEPCTQIGTEMFFTEEEKGRKVSVQHMRRVCGGCPMLEECGEYALHTQVQGFWGGMSEGERRRIRRARNIMAEPIYESA